MTLSSAQLARFRLLFGWLFVVSLVVCVGFSAFISLPENSPTVRHITLTGHDVPPPPMLEPASSGLNLPLVISLSSLMTSATSVLGFFITSVLAWRKERREGKHHGLDLEKKMLEIERLRLELETARIKDKT
jgi:hypothetical protein